MLRDDDADGSILPEALDPNPTQDWLSRQMTEAFPWDTAPRYLLRDRDKSYGRAFRHRVRAMGIMEVITAPRSPWQNPYAERLIGSIRRECLDHVLIFSEGTSVAYYRAILSTITTPEHIFRSARSARGLVPFSLPRLEVLSPSRK
jgi:transposase InsO family protein